jgi:AcrR family transcriptional regulator
VSAERRDRGDLRERIIDAAFHVIRERGMTRARTSTIAEAAGCAEGSIYRYFSGKPELLSEVVRARLPDVDGFLEQLPSHAGTASVRDHLVGVSRAASTFYGAILPLAAGILADAELLEEHRELFTGADLGSGCWAEAVAAYLREEQRLGRVDRDVDADAAARVVLDSALAESFLDALHGPGGQPAERGRRLSESIDLLIAGLDVGRERAR